jgi:hypothetical protein
LDKESTIFMKNDSGEIVQQWLKGFRRLGHRKLVYSPEA